MNRRDFVRSAAAAGLAGTLPAPGIAAKAGPSQRKAPQVLVRRTVRPVVISDMSGYSFRNGGKLNAVERAFDGITRGEDVLDALIAGVNIPELDPEETGIGYGGLPNAEGVVQLDASCMHGPKRWAGGVAAIEGVKTPSLVARAVMLYTDHHLLAGKGAQDFAREMGFEILPDLNTDRSRKAWLEWKRRTDPGHWLDPQKRTEVPPDTSGGGAGGSGPGSAGTRTMRPAARGGARGNGPIRRRRRADGSRQAWREWEERGYRAALDMAREGLIPLRSLWGTVNCDGISPGGDICGVTTTSGLSFKIPGRVGDSPILGAGLYVDNDVGACGSTGRGEANLYNLSSYLIVENMRHGMHPTDAGMATLERVRASTVEKRLLNSRGLPAFDLRFFILNKGGEHVGVALYGAEEKTYAVCTENGAETRTFEALLQGSPLD
jgi:N4-(beta-N-acetylglucosaminyl)-L-asparaginase